MRPLLITIASLLSLAAHADVYRWVDENGQVRYGDQPPVGAQRLKAPPGPANPVAPKPAPNPTFDINQEASTTARFDEICNELNARLASYKSNPYLAVQGDDGKPRALSPEEREKLIADTQKQADAACRQAQPQ